MKTNSNKYLLAKINFPSQENITMAKNLKFIPKGKRHYSRGCRWGGGRQHLLVLGNAIDSDI